MGRWSTFFGLDEAPNEVETRSVGPYFSVSDPALAEYLGLTGSGIAGVTVTDNSALGVTTFYRCVALIAGTIAGLPMKAYRRRPNGDGRDEVGSWTDNPAGPYPLTPFAWKELVLVHLLTRGEAFLRHTYNGAGAIVGLWPVHPSAVTVEWAGADKVFKVQNEDGTKDEYTTADMTHVMSMSLDGLRGTSPLAAFRHSIGITIAGEQSAGRTFGNGMLVAGIVTPEDDMTEDEAKVVKAGLSAKLTGVANAGDIAVVNRKLRFTPWSMTNADAQFLESRTFQVNEIARIFGVPPHLVGETEKQTSWGTGVAEQNLGLSRYVLMGWTSRLEEALTALLPRPQFVEFDYAGLLQGSTADEIKLLIEQVKAGLLTVDEARAIRNLAPLPASERPQLKSVEDVDAA